MKKEQLAFNFWYCTS